MRVCGVGLVAIVLLSWATGAAAREGDGALGLILSPHDGAPALVLRGGSFEAVLRERAELRLRSEGAPLALETAWRELPGDRVGATCTVPMEAEAGVYRLEAVAESGSGSDGTGRSVFVYEAFPEQYRIAHVGDAAVDVAALNASGAELALFTGNLTERAEADEFRSFLKGLEGCTIPTFVSPGVHDGAGRTFERFFGPAIYAFKFGEDGFLCFDTKGSGAGDELGAEVGALQRLRRGIKASRWSIGFTHRYGPELGMRSQLVLFSDNPLDCLIVSHGPLNKAGEGITGWGKTRVRGTPTGSEGALRLFEIAPSGLQPVEGR